MSVVAVSALAVLWRGSRRARMWVLLLVASVTISDAVCSRVIKPLFPRERPCQALARGMERPSGFALRVVHPEECPGSRSLPSNHAANTMAIASVGWYLTRRRTRWTWYLLPAMMGWTRIYLGYHYPSDVAAGWMVGALAAAILLSAVRRAFPPSNAPSCENAGSAG